MNQAILQARIDKAVAQLEALEDAAIALALGTIQSYEFDTGQSKTRVTKFDIKDLNDAIASVENRIDVLCARLNPGSASVHVQPAW